MVEEGKCLRKEKGYQLGQLIPTSRTRITFYPGFNKQFSYLKLLVEIACGLLGIASMDYSVDGKTLNCQERKRT